MQYQRQLDTIWLRLQDLSAPQPRHAVTTREAFDDVCAAFMQAELGPEGDEEAYRWGGEQGEIIDDVKTYRAEWNVWAYYYGEKDPFPGIDPILHENHNHNSFTEPRQRDTYIPSYSIQNTNSRMEDIGPELRGRHANEKDRADDQKERALRAIERRAEEAKKFMEYRRRKNKERKERRKRILSMEDGRDGDSEAMEGTESYGSEGDGYREPTDGYSRDAGAKAGRYAERADGDLTMGMGWSGSQRRERSMSPTRDGAGGEWRGGAYGAGYGEARPNWGYDTSGRDEQGRQQERGLHDGRSDYVNPRDFDRQRGMGGPVRRERGQDDTDGSAYNDQNRRRPGFQPRIRTSKEDRGGGSRKDIHVNSGRRRQPPSLRREDAGRLVGDDGIDWTSHWVRDSQEQVQDAYQDEAYHREVPKARETGSQGRRDRGFGILEDEKECYREERNRRRKQ
ncbi:hypothetical protein DL98DRAFT_595336 [Cadophora sp. DSE1049]|nr:hypothetical protein DL98DRAFT_595336 [Cadophora sp. DSE1049]